MQRLLPCLRLLLSPVVLAGNAVAAEIPGGFTSVQPMGMGNAFTAVANDENSVWTNPAGVGRSRKARSRNTFNLTKVPNLIAGANAQSRTFYKAFKGSQDKSVEGVLGDSTDLGDKPFWARAGIFPVTLFDVSRNSPMAFGLYSDTTIEALIPKDTPEEAQVTAISDVGAVLTFGWADDQNRFNAGFNVRPVLRYALEDRFPSEDLLHKTAMQKHLQDDSNKGQGLGLDFGLLYTMADFWYPTVGFAIRNLPTGCKADYLNPYTEKRENVCGTVYKGAIGNPDALSTVDPTDVRGGLSITPRIGRKLNLRFAADVHHLPLGTAQQSYGLLGIEASKLIHAGVELFPGNPLTAPPVAVRAGYSQGFITAGFSLELGVFDIEFATYGVDVSTTSKPVEDRRYLASLSVDF